MSSGGAISLLWTLVIIVIVVVIIVVLLHVLFAVIAIGPLAFYHECVLGANQMLQSYNSLSTMAQHSNL